MLEGFAQEEPTFIAGEVQEELLAIFSLEAKEVACFAGGWSVGTWSSFRSRDTWISSKGPPFMFSSFVQGAISWVLGFQCPCQV
jgi:hypothetical protein